MKYTRIGSKHDYVVKDRKIGIGVFKFISDQKRENETIIKDSDGKTYKLRKIQRHKTAA